MEQPIEVLSIEDNPADTALLKDWFQQYPGKCNYRFVRDGLEALDYLYQRNHYAGAVRPDLILLDLNVPKVDGRDLLREVKTNPDLRRIPILVLTTSSSDRDISDAYDLGANAFISKPLDLDDVDAMLASLGKFWLGSARLPRRSR